MEDQREHIHSMLSTIERYNPGNLGELTSYLKNTCDAGVFDIEACLAILKLYQFNTAQFDLATTRTILLKALTSMPENSFMLCLYLLSEEQHAEESIQEVIELSRLLETCSFTEFWDALKAKPALNQGEVKMEDDEGNVSFAKVDIGFVDRIHVAHVVKITYQNISKGLLVGMLGNPNDGELKAIMDKHGWQDKGSDKIFIAPQDERVKSKNIVESISFDSLTSIMAAAQPR